MLNNIIQKECKQHGVTNYILEKSGYYRCKKCRSNNVTNYRISKKAKLITLFGGKCEICGYNKCQGSLHFHHVDPKIKSFGIAKSGVCRSLNKILNEVNKCILVCANCHGEIEFGVLQIPKRLLERFK